MHWSGPENIAWVKVDDEGSWAFLDSDSTINAVLWSSSKLFFGWGSPGQPSRLYSEDKWVWGFVFLTYVIIRVQVEGEKGYDEDQITLVILDMTAFGSRVLATLGTPTINQIVNVIKDSEIDELSVSLNGSRISCLLAGHQVELSLKNNITARSIPDLTNINEAVKMMKQEEIEAFSSQIVHGHTKTVLQGNGMYVMTQASEKGEEPCLPQWFMHGKHLHQDDCLE